LTVIPCNFQYSTRRLIGSRLIESAAYCNYKLLVPLFPSSSLNMSVNWISWLLLSRLCRPKVIPLSGWHYNSENVKEFFLPRVRRIRGSQALFLLLIKFHFFTFLHQMNIIVVTMKVVGLFRTVLAHIALKHFRPFGQILSSMCFLHVVKQCVRIRTFEGAIGTDECLSFLFVWVFRFWFSKKFEENVRFADVETKHLKRQFWTRLSSKICHLCVKVKKENTI